MKLTDSPKTMGEVMKASPEQLLHWHKHVPASLSKAEKRVYDRVASKISKLNNDSRGRKTLSRYRNETPSSEQNMDFAHPAETNSVEEEP
jgi:hypothetical protein